MGVLFDVLIPALIILGVGFVWLRALLSKFIPPGTGAARPPAPHPRSFASSGGAPRPQTVATEQPVRQVPAQRAWDGYEPTGDVEKARPRNPQGQTNKQSGWMQRHPRVAETAQARLLAKALDSPESTRTAFLIKEVLEPPVSMRQ